MQVAQLADLEAAAPFMDAHALKGAVARLVFVDGLLAPELCAAEGLPEGVFVGSAAHAPDNLASQHMVRRWQACEHAAGRARGPPHGCRACTVHSAPIFADVLHVRTMQGRQARVRGTPFALVNGATARDAACVEIPAGVQLEGPVHVLYISTGAHMRCS